jgi:PAS domain S-box-containing protein
MLSSDSFPPAAPIPPNPHDALLALRARAEKRRHLVTQATEHHSAEEMQRLVQELQVHQIELEMQYEELLLAQADAQAARSEYLDLFDFAPVAYYTLSPVGAIQQLNLCGAKYLGTVRQRLVGRRFALFVPPAGRLEFGQFLAKVLSTDTTQSTDMVLQREDGATFHGHLEGMHVETPTGPQCRLAVVDTTARQRALEALAASEARFRQLFAESSDAVVLMQGHQFVDCNTAALRLLGASSRKQVVGRVAWSYSPEFQPDGRRTVDLLREATAAALRMGSKRFEALMRKATGEDMWVEAVLTPMELAGHLPLVHILWRDITAARAAEQELRESRERLQMALAASQSGVWQWDMASQQLHWDANAQAIFGQPYGPEPVPFAVLRAAIHPDDLPLVAARLKAATAEHQPFSLECRVVWPEGRLRYVAALGKAEYDEQGRPRHLIGIVHDVTARHAAEIELRRQKEFNESLLENSVDGIIALDREYNITAWNAEVGRYFGQEAATVLGRPVFEVLPFMDEKSHEAVKQALAGERVACPGRPFHVRPGHYDAYLVPLEDDGPQQPSGVLIIMRDVTERDRLTELATQQRLRQQQEVLAAILTTQETERKRIAEAIHNGLGQLLYATKLNLETPHKGAAAPPTEALKLLNEAIRTTRTISFELTPGILEDFGLRTALEELVKRVARARLPVRLHLTNIDERMPPPVEIAVYRVVQELLNNVMKHAQATEVEVHVVREANRLEVSVEDNGHGFDPAVLATQPLAGIGLPGVRNRVTLLGGELSIKSRVGQGTIVSFELGL